MPLARYFLFVGGALLTLLFIADAYLPKPPAVARVDVDPPVIRIHSDRKWPERVVFDTSLPTVMTAASANAQVSVPASATIAKVSVDARVRDAFARLQPSYQKPAQLSDVKKMEPQPKRKLARRRAASPRMLVAQQPPFGFFARNTW